MLKNQLRRDLRWLKRQARRDRRIAVSLLTAVLAVWTRQLPGGSMGTGVVLAISSGLLAASGAAWLASAYFLVRAGRVQAEPVEALRWVSRVQRGKEWAFCSLAAYVAWHALMFMDALL
ncbi:hypothetical protein ACIBG8_25860 [Nonomuraea sp. NPDC050556]|uniref:hypothetical protein n=1 Tax=Nonomuraea sp. NPDC050556 TaxID=3364369 RepID=UPI0037B8512C